MLQMLGIVFVGVLAMYGPAGVSAHGRLVEPASRNSMWRYNYKNPRNYNDMGLNCGGFTNQFERHRGQCGVCGDPWQGPRDHEAGGKYARGLVARQYKTGAFINVTVELTSNHRGYFEFRLCPVNDPNKKATQPCLDKNLLNIVGHGTRYFISKGGASIFIELIVMLPPKLKCSQCVLQWKWVAGQSMGPDGYGGECMGCGNQEHFVNCADIAIGTKPVTPLPLLPEDLNPTTPQPGTDSLHGPGYHVHNAPTAPNTNNYEVNMATLVKQIYNSIASGVQGMQTSTPSWTGTSFSQPPPAAPQWNSVPQTQSSMSSMWQQADVTNLLGEPFGWASAAASPSLDFPGYETGEYPELSELHAHTPGASTNYLKGYNDALSQMQDTFGFPGMSVKASPAFSEVSLSLQEAQKGAFGTSFSSPMLTAPKSCADGSEMECRASNPMFSLEFNSFCQNSCSLGQCQGNTEICTCSCPGSQPLVSQAIGAGAGSNCRAVDRTKAGSMDRWCVLNCRQNNCPSNLCVCG